MSDVALIEIIARMSAAVLCLLTCTILLVNARQSLAARLGALFGFGAFAYMICTSPALVELFGVWQIPLVPFSWLDGVFFWWFCLALFCDRYQFRVFHIWPAIPIIILTPLRFMVGEGVTLDVITAIKQLISILLFMHATYFALLSLKDDLVNSRRYFRVGIAVSVGASAIILMGLDMMDFGPRGEEIYQVSSAIWLLVLSFAFAMWALRASPNMFIERPAREYRHDPVATEQRIEPADKPLLARLNTAMEEGLYRETGLTVGKLADQLGAPEHRLRKLINQGLGYRNFSSYINAHRVEDAKEILADPEQARLQILQVALDLGYGSIASFNRAFREATGEAPTSFRRKALMAD
ncbi:helix-turn-helix domain-containing protein [Hyphobacterium sp.]|uniref:AraC family transcriptional regulator n=1 Tax=Hyphobacterium sp. TaxID=2004662 RepID=UPI003BAA87BE